MLIRKHWNDYITNDLKTRILKKQIEKRKKKKEKEELEEKLKVVREKRLKEENVSLEIEDISENNIVLENEVLENEVVLDKLPYFYIDYSPENIEFSNKYGYESFLIDKKIGITGENIDNIMINNAISTGNHHIIINLWKVLTKSNLNNISYECSDIDYKKFINLFENKYKWGAKGSKLKEGLTKEEIEDYSLIYDGVFDFFKILYKKKKKIFIISHAHNSFIENILKHYKIDKFVEKVIAPSMCGVPYVYVDGTETIKNSRKINIERFFIYIERYIGRLAR
jgi:hypothetical protein